MVQTHPDCHSEHRTKLQSCHNVNDVMTKVQNTCRWFSPLFSCMWFWESLVMDECSVSQLSRCVGFKQTSNRQFSSRGLTVAVCTHCSCQMCRFYNTAALLFFFIYIYSLFSVYVTVSRSHSLQYTIIVFVINQNCNY